MKSLDGFLWHHIVGFGTEKTDLSQDDSLLNYSVSLFCHHLPTLIFTYNNKKKKITRDICIPSPVLKLQCDRRTTDDSQIIVMLSMPLSSNWKFLSKRPASRNSIDIFLYTPLTILITSNSNSISTEKQHMRLAI